MIPQEKENFGQLSLITETFKDVILVIKQIHFFKFNQQ